MGLFDGTDPSSLQMDPDTLRALAAQYGPSDEDKSASRRIGLLQAAGAMFGARRGYEGNAIGNAVQSGLLGYQTNIKDLMAQRTSNIAQAMQMRTMALQQQTLNSMPGMSGSSPSPSGAQGQSDQGAASPPTGTDQGNGVTTYPFIDTSMAPAAASSPAPGVSPTSSLGSANNYNNWVQWNARRVAVGLPDMSKSIDQMYPKPTSIRPGGDAIYPDGRVRHSPIIAADATFDPNGNVVAVPGAGAARDALLRHEAMNKEVKVPVSTGGDMPMLLGDTPRYSGQQQPSPGVTGPSAVPPPPMQPGAAQSALPAQPQKPYFGTIPASTAPASVVGQPQTTFSKTNDEARAKNSIEIQNEINTRGGIAAANMANYTAMENLANLVGKTGVTTPHLIEAGRLAIALGISPDTVKEITGSSPSPAEAFSKLLAISAGQSVKQNVSASRPTQFEYGTFLNATPNLAMTPGGRNAAIAIMKGSAAHAMAEQQAAQDWSSSHGGDLTGFPAWYTATNAPDKYLPSGAQLQKLTSTPAQPAVQLTPFAKGNLTAGTYAKQAIKSGSMSLDELRSLGYIK